MKDFQGFSPTRLLCRIVDPSCGKSGTVPATFTPAFEKQRDRFTGLGNLNFPKAGARLGNASQPGK